MQFPVKDTKESPKKHRSPFTREEDALLRQLVQIYGSSTKSWDQIAACLPNRNSRQCRERYRSYLDPELTNGPWTPEEDQLLRELVNEHGTKWVNLVKFFKGRSDSNIKNRWYTYINKTTAATAAAGAGSPPTTPPQAQSSSPVVQTAIPVMTAREGSQVQAVPLQSQQQQQQQVEVSLGEFTPVAFDFFPTMEVEGFPASDEFYLGENSFGTFDNYGFAF